MIKHIEIVEGERHEKYIKRFLSQVRRFRYMGFMVVGIVIAVSGLLAVSYATGRSTAMTLGFSMALVAVFSVPFMMMYFNKSWQLGSDSQTDHVQVLTGRVSLIKKESKGRKNYLILTVDNQVFTINEEYCSGVEKDKKVAITVGISSKVPVEVSAVEE